MIGSFLYVITTRPYAMQSIGLVSIFQLASKETHVETVKRIFSYMKGTMEYGLWYPKGNDFSLKEFAYRNWEGSIDDRNSTTGIFFYLKLFVIMAKQKETLHFTFDSRS